jgi:hypothetical protein
MMKKGFILIMAFVLISTSGCAHTYKGRVIDAETKEPIEGAAVVASWRKEKAVLAGSHEKLKDVKETLTDENGEWTIKGPKGRGYDEISLAIGIVSFLPFVYYTLRPNFIIFKPGYCSWPKGRQIGACRGIDYHSDEGYWEGATVDLPRLTEKGDRMGALPGIVSEINGTKWARKQKTYLKLLNQENRYLGLGEYDYDFLKEDNK